MSSIVADMTSVVAWERQLGTLSELVVVSDSRLGGGEEWDACAKIFDLGRDDCVLAMAGDTWRALPLVLQLVATTRSYNGSLLRTLDLPQFAGHVREVLNLVLSEAGGAASRENPDCEFLLAGWSWKMARFRIYRYKFDARKWEFVVHRTVGLPRALRGAGRGTILTTIGDGGRRLQGNLARAYGVGTIEGPLDYHPLEYLYRQTQDGAVEEHSVGGPVQVSKIYRSIRVEHFAVLTPEGLSTSGRPVLQYENLDLRTISRSPEGTWLTSSTRPQIEAPNSRLQALDVEA